MGSYFNEHAQLFYAIEKKEGGVYLGYAPDRSEAEANCVELVEERKNEIDHGTGEELVH